MHAILDNAIRLLRSGRLAQAEAECDRVLSRNPADAAALQVRGLALRQQGRLEQAETSLRGSVALAPRNAEFRTNLAQLLGAREKIDESCAEFERAIGLDSRFRPARLGLARLANRTRRFALAEREARALIAMDERDAEAWSALGVALLGMQRGLDARAAFERAVSIAPGYGAARYYLAAALCEEEQSERALEQLAHAARLGVAHRGVVLARARALMQLDRYEEAEAELGRLIAEAPYDTECQFMLAQLRHVRGDPEFARSFQLAASRSDAPLPVLAAYADVMRLAGNIQAAEALLRQLLQRYGPVPELLSSMGTVLQAAGRYEEAVDCARRALAAQPDNVTAAENCVAALLSAGDPAQALPIIERFGQLSPRDQRWITYRADVARQRGEDLFEELCDFDRFVRSYDLQPPRGYGSIEELHQAVAGVLNSRHRQALHPLDQSLRSGTQTSRGLLVEQDPAIKTLLSMLEDAVAAFQSELGVRAEHPFLARNTAAARIVGCWSVKLRRGGFHVNHIHPQGWLSSAYYVSVPAEVRDAQARSGWIKFGEPRFAMPGGEPCRYVQPRPGRLVLFPSYMWHGTTPIVGDEPRLTVAFDALPGSSA